MHEEGSSWYWLPDFEPTSAEPTPEEAAVDRRLYFLKGEKMRFRVKDILFNDSGPSKPRHLGCASSPLLDLT